MTSTQGVNVSDLYQEVNALSKWSEQCILQYKFLNAQPILTLNQYTDTKNYYSSIKSYYVKLWVDSYTLIHLLTSFCSGYSTFYLSMVMQVMQ